MKSILTLLLCAASLLVNGQTMYPENIPGCVARWTFGTPGTILYDSSGNNNHGAKYDVGSRAGWNNKPNAAGDFNGTSSYSLVPNASTLQSPAFTIVVLMKFDSFYSGTCQVNQIVSKGDHYNTGHYGMGVFDNIYDTHDCYNFDPQHQSLVGYAETVPSNNIPLTSFIKSGRWYFLAITYDSDSLTNYQVMMDSSAFNPSIAPFFQAYSGAPLGTNSSSMSIGRQMSAQYPYWVNGAMDEVAIFNRKLSKGELQKIYAFLYNGQSLSLEEDFEQKSIASFIHNGTLNLQIPAGTRVDGIGIYNVAGQKLLSLPSYPASGIDVSQLGGQMLIVRVQTAAGLQAVKVVNP